MNSGNTSSISGYWLKHILLGLLVFLLFVPIIEKKLNIIKVKPLGGYVASSAQDTVISVKGWLSGDYQAIKEEHFNEAFGFRNIFVRLNNQLAFNFFNKTSAEKIIIGKENYLYSTDYFKAYYGQDFIGADSVLHRMQRLKFLQDTLQKLNKTLLLVIAPDKASFYPEYIPDEYRSTIGKTNYEYHAKYAAQLGVNVIDFNKYFLGMKNTSTYLLYPKYGIHWSYYSECIAADSMVKYIEHARNITMPDIYWTRTEPDANPRERDADIEDGMNLLFNLKGPMLAYPNIQFQSDSGKVKVSSIVISDSFYWEMFNFGFSSLFSSSQFWFYNAEVYPEYYTNKLNTGQVDLKDAIEKHDVIILMASDAKLDQLGWGFIEKAYRLFKYGVEHDAAYYEKVKNAMIYIRSDKNWMKKIIQDAKENKIPVDSALKGNAMWIIEH